MQMKLLFWKRVLCIYRCYLVASILLKSGKQIACGESRDVLIPDILETIYSAKFILDEGKTGSRILATR